MPGIVRDAFSLPVVAVLFVEGVVGQVNEHVPHVLGVRAKVDRLVRLCGEADQTLLVHVDLEWVRTDDQHVDPHVKFESVNKVRVVDVLLRYGWLIQGELVDVVCQENATALSFVVRFRDHCETLWNVRTCLGGCFALCGNYFLLCFRSSLLAKSEVVNLIWQNPCSWEELVVVGKDPLESF